MFQKSKTRLVIFNMMVVLMAAAAALAVVLDAGAAVAATADEDANVIITQVLYDPVGSESSGEAVELYNPTRASINISGWSIGTETSAADAVIPHGSIICSSCYFLVSDLNWSAGKDNSSWPGADYEEGMTLANADAGVALKDSNGLVVDAVGWGNAAGVESGLFEGVPHSGSTTGNSLRRKVVNGSYVDTNSNNNDFADSTPDFHSLSSVAAKDARISSDINIVIVITGSGPVVSGLAILQDDDILLAGSQVSPVPKNNRTVNVEAIVSDENGLSDVETVALAFNGISILMAKKAGINATAGVYSANLSLSSSFPAGNYAVTARAVDFSGFSGSASASFEYLSLAAIDVDSTSIVFFASPGATAEVVGDNSASTLGNVTITNAGNVQLDFDIWSTNFTSGSSLIDSSRLEYSFNGSYGASAAAGSMTNSKARKDINLNPGSKTGLSLRLNVPVATLPGNYSGRVSLVAVNS